MDASTLFHPMKLGALLGKGPWTAVLHLLLQVDYTKAEQENFGECLKYDVIKKTIAEKENTSKVYVCNICENSFMYKYGIFDDISNIHNYCIICNLQFNDVKAMN